MSRSHKNEKPEEYGGLTDEQMAAADKFLEGIPYMNFGALFMPPIWGPGHGSVLPILFYPLWIFCDNVFYAAYSAPSALSIIAAIIIFVVMAAVTIAYGRLSQVGAWQKAYEKGMTKEQYLAREKKWAVAMIIVAVVLLAIATWFNLCMRPTMGW